MVDTIPSGAAAATPAVPAEPGQAGSGAGQPVDPLQAVENAATTEKRIDSSFIDSLSPEQQKALNKFVESKQSKAVNDALKSKTESGAFMTHDQVEAKMRRMVAEEREVFQTKLQAREAFYNHLAEFSILPGTPDYQAWNAEFNTGAYNPDRLGEKAVVEKIARIAGVGRFRTSALDAPTSPYLGSVGVPLRTLQGADGKVTSTTGNAVLDDAMALLNALPKK